MVLARRLNLGANICAGLAVTLVLLASLAPLPGSVALLLGTCGGILAAVVVLTWLTAGRLTRPRRRLWSIGVVWVLLAGLGAWIVGYAVALRGNPARFADGRVDASPLGFGAWFGVLVLVAGAVHLRWLHGVRRAPASDPGPQGPGD